VNTDGLLTRSSLEDINYAMQAYIEGSEASTKFPCLPASLRT
jgi:hypothetical protein